MRIRFPWALLSLTLCGAAMATGEPTGESRVLGADSCSTSGCHGGAGLNRGAYHLWKRSDPHLHAPATLTNGQSAAMAQKMGLPDASAAVSCTVCHAPMKNVPPSLFMPGYDQKSADKDFSCANCHGGSEHWLLSHTRPEYPRAALEKLGMRPLGSAYQRANACVACHQNLSDALMKANHPPLIFELDGLLVEQPKHWREDADFSHAKTWLVGQAVALRECEAQALRAAVARSGAGWAGDVALRDSVEQALREPGEERKAEIEAIQELLSATGLGWTREAKTDLVKAADDFAQKMSAAPMSHAQTRASLQALLRHRKPFEIGAFASVAAEHRMRAVGHYAERLALALDRLNQALIAAGEKAAFPEQALNELFKAAPPAKSFDADIAENFVRKLDSLLASGP